MDDRRAPDLLGAPYESRCWIHFPGDAEEYCAKLRAGKEREAKVPNLKSCHRCGIRHNESLGLCATCDAILESEFGPAQKPVINCLGCKSPATNTHGYCAYCQRRCLMTDAEITYRRVTDSFPKNIVARARISAWSEREKPRSTASSLELAKPHPWEEFE